MHFCRHLYREVSGDVADLKQQLCDASEANVEDKVKKTNRLVICHDAIIIVCIGLI